MPQINEITGLDYRTGQPIRITLQAGTIGAVTPAPPAAEPSPPIYIAPGFVDLQVNGFMGHDINSFPLEPETVKAVVAKLLEEGVTTLYPTVTTNSDERIEEAMRVLAQACREDAACAAAIAGIHLEGPFISPEDGPRGAHQAQYVKAPDYALFVRWQEAAEGRIRIVTLSPEWPEAPGFMRRATEGGVIAAIGHTAASPEQIREAVQAGARMSTHWGNGAHLMLPRHPNYLWEQLAQEELHTCLIADGFHLPEAVLRVAAKVKGDRTLLVSDAVHLGGLPPGTYWSHKRVQVVKTEEGKLHLADNPKLLAGSVQPLPWGVGHLVRCGICELPQAWAMASLYPARLMGLPSEAGLAAEAPADLVRFRLGDNNEIEVLETYKNGFMVWQKQR
ncbi:N-acetylglucosamine-6-phosphate deacetylase [Paenibacillus koleovorans]|uniref:N-acetylglucosamine-6-phosphate deacetylase n=1 Tax=Paenibacillus koleovorans TaxID=121608 RepID=UPI000FD802FB|nr:amidohydrolase family protein [Paenibacillus koleovorans]